MSERTETGSQLEQSMSRLERNIYGIMSGILSFQPYCLIYRALCPETEVVTSYILKMQAINKTTGKKYMFVSYRLKVAHKLMLLNLDQKSYLFIWCANLYKEIYLRMRAIHKFS
jgi:hypothetical protein